MVAAPDSIGVWPWRGRQRSFSSAFSGGRRTYARPPRRSRRQRLILRPGAQILHLDVMDYVSTTFRKIYTDYYIKLVTKPPGAVGACSIRPVPRQPPTPVSQKLRRAVERLSTPAPASCHRCIRAECDRLHAFSCQPSFMMARDRQGPGSPFRSGCRSPISNLHRMWVIPRMTGFFFAGNEEVGLPSAPPMGSIPARIHVHRHPDHAGIRAETWQDGLRRGIRARSVPADLSLDGAAEQALGVAPLAKRLVANRYRSPTRGARRQEQAGAGGIASLRCQAAGGSSSRWGSTQEVPRLMAAADLVITKPGGLSTSELPRHGARRCC